MREHDDQPVRPGGAAPRPGGEKATRRRGQALEEAILDAAWGVLETDGWGGFTFGAVADRAHSSKPVLYRRWRNREELLRATLRRRGEISPGETPDTGSLRGDTIALLTRINELRSSMAAVMSMWLSAQFQDLHLPPAELRREFLADREPAMEVIVARAMARGELGPKTPPARVISLAPDLLRHELLMTLEPVTPEAITQIVDDAFLPLARLLSGLSGSES
jgi:AcrR family transcriptional regulator